MDGEPAAHMDVLAAIPKARMSRSTRPRGAQPFMNRPAAPDIHESPSLPGVHESSRKVENVTYPMSSAVGRQSASR